MLHASDSDDEVRAIVREVRALLADGVAAHRIAVLHPVAGPYARLLHDHLAASGIATNGPGVRPLRDHAIADGYLALLALDPDDLRRDAFFDWLGRVPVRIGDGTATVPRTRWERLSREAGITGGDWAERLADHEARHQARLDADRDNPDASERSLAYRERSILETQEFGAFVAELRHRLQEGRALTGWAALGEWARAMFRRYVGPADAMTRLPEPEQRAASAIDGVLGAIVELEAIGDTPRLSELVEILEVDLDARKPRVGRFGDGVFVGPISAAPSLDVSHLFVLGLSEDLYPGRHRIDPLLSEPIRIATEGALPTARDRLRRDHRAVLAAFAAGDHVVASFPRGDLRRGAERLPSRWLMPTLRALTEQPELEATRWAEASGPELRSVASHWEGVSRADRPGSEQEWRLRHFAGGGVLVDDDALGSALEHIDARRADDFTRFDGNLEGVEGLPDYADGSALISPTALERYADCPHTFFVERMLNVKPLETPEEIITIRPWDLGSIVHEVMDRLTTEADALPGYGEPWSAADRERMHAITNEVMNDFERRGLTGHPRLWDRERDRLHQDLEAILDLDDAAHRARDSRVVASELPFGMRGHAPVRIELENGSIAMRGSADRVDETRDGTLIVTDFKTGSAKSFTDISEDPVVAGKKLQLPLYAHAARAAFGNDNVDAGYWFIGRRDRGKRVDVRLDAHLEEVYRSALETLTTGIRDGRFIARPPASDDFAWVQCAFCNPDGVGYGHVRGAERAQAHGCRAREPLRTARPVGAHRVGVERGGERMTLADQPARDQIRSELHENLFVDAGAGTGKTSALVGRVVGSVMDDGVPLAETAVVTFTEKAGTELRDRLRAAFEKAHTAADDRATRARAQAALDDLDGGRDRHAALVRAAGALGLSDPGGHAAAHRSARRGRFVGRVRRTLVGDVATDAGRRRPRRAAGARPRGGPQRRPAALARACVRQRLGPHRVARARRRAAPDDDARHRARCCAGRCS